MKTSISRIKQFAFSLGEVNIREFNPGDYTHTRIELKVKNKKKGLIDSLQDYFQKKITPENYLAYLKVDSIENRNWTTYGFEISPRESVSPKDYEKVNRELIDAIPHMLKDFNMRNKQKK